MHVSYANDQACVRWREAALCILCAEKWRAHKKKLGPSWALESQRESAIVSVQNRVLLMSLCEQRSSQQRPGSWQQSACKRFDRWVFCFLALRNERATELIMEP